MFSEKFKEFLKSDNLMYKFEAKEGTKQFAQKLEASENINIIYLYNIDNVLKRVEMMPSFLVDKEGNLLSVNNIYACEDFQKDGSFSNMYEESKKINESFREFEREIERAVEEKLKEMESDFLKDYDKNEYREKALNSIVSGNKPYYNIYFSYDNHELFFLDNFYFNRKDFFEKTVEKVVEKEKEEYKKCFLTKHELAEIERENLEDDNKKFKNELVKILDSDKHKTLKIYYTYPNNDKGFLEFKKDDNSYRIAQYKRDILSNDKLLNVPVFSIDSIKWSRSTLLEKKNFNITVKNSDILNTFAELDEVEHFPAEYYKDKGFIKKIVEKNDSNLSLADESLMKDKKFCEDIVEVLNDARVGLKYFDKEITSERTFFEKVFEKINENRRRYMLDYIPKEVLEDYDFVKFLKSKNISITDIADHVSESFIFTKQFEEILNGEKLTSINLNYLPKYRIDFLTKFISEKFICKYFDNIDFSKESADKIAEYIDKGANLNIFENKISGISLFDYFKDDEYMTYELSKTISSSYGITPFLRSLGINTDTNNDSILPFCSYNTLFMNMLNKDNLTNFVENEIASIDSFEVDEDSSIVFKTDFCKIILEKEYYSTSFGRLEFNSNDTRNRKYNVDRDTREKAYGYLKNYVKELTGVTVNDFKDMREALVDFKEKQKEKEEIDR